jgi:formylmethanofuran dehydrogenase subunit E
MEQTPWERLTAFHDAVTPELALGYRAVMIGMREIGFKPRPDCALIVRAGVTSAAIDAFQLLCKTTWGNGRLLRQDAGQHVYDFHYTGTADILRLSIQPEILAHLTGATANDSARLRQQKHMQAIEALLSAAESAFCTISHLSGKLQPRDFTVQHTRCAV